VPAKVKAERPRKGSPTHAGEMRAFAAVAITTGICEEVMYRGYLLYYLTEWLSAGAALAAAIGAFGLWHVYQGRRGVLQTTIAGAIGMGIYLFTGSLLAPMVLHATVDLANGFMGYRALQDGEPPLQA